MFCLVISVDAKDHQHIRDSLICRIFVTYYRDKTGTYCGLSLAPFFLEHLPQLEVLHLDGVDNVVVGGLAVAQQVRFRQGRIGARALFLQVKKATWVGGFFTEMADNVVVGYLAVAQQIRFRQGRIGALALFSPGKEGYLGGGGGCLHLDSVGSVP